MRPKLDGEFYLGNKKCYAIDRDATIEVLIDCEMWPGMAYLSIPMTPEQFIEWQTRANRTGGRLIQDIFPAMKSEVREALVTGITPAEWRAKFGEKGYTVQQLQDFGYNFDEEYLASVTNTDEKNKS